MKRRSLVSMLISCCLAFGCQVVSAAERPLPPEHHDGSRPAAAPHDLAWPAVTRQTRPWTYWWWMGSAVDRVNLANSLQAYQKAGIGGVHVVPIYGVRGAEGRFLEYLSPKWLGMLEYAATEARRLGMGVDMSTGTGWPFGGPHVRANDVAMKAHLVLLPADTKKWKKPLDHAAVRALVAYDSADPSNSIDITDHINSDGTLDWKAPSGDWNLVGLVVTPTGQRVKRAAPGGAGPVLNPFSSTALQHYLKTFDRAFSTGHFPNGAVRAQYHDSFEYYQAGWSEQVRQAYPALHGYNLSRYLPALAGVGTEQTVRRARTDYCSVLDSLHLQYITQWTAWAHQHGCVTRNQAHGAPGNLLDLYAAADIPETEIFGAEGGDPLMSKFASSAAHVTGKRLVSSETCTWLGEHFCVELADTKGPIDTLFASGINHIFYHGMAYSPKNAEWPGWLFYASTNFAPSNSFWRDFPALNTYVARCQAVLQSGRPDNDVLLYWPVADLWYQSNRMVRQLTVHESWLAKTDCGKTARKLWDRGYAFDYVSDRQLQAATVDQGQIKTAGNVYRVIVLPHVHQVPVETMVRLLQLAGDGATVISVGDIPRDVPGIGRLQARRGQLHAALARLQLGPANDEQVRSTPLGNGRVLVGPSVEPLLHMAGVHREPAVDHGLLVIRRALADGHYYFLSNQSSKPLDRWVPFGTQIKSAGILDPMTGNTGVASVCTTRDNGSEVFLQLLPTQSCIVRTFTSRLINGQAWNYLRPTSPRQTIAGTWHVEFVRGGPVLPKPFDTDQLVSWTRQNDPEAKRFAGTARYQIQFELPKGKADDWILELGKVAASARVEVNGHEAAVLFARPFHVAVGQWLHPGKNTLQIDVTNLPANRIADMDRRGVPWKRFLDINYVNIAYKPFDASGWPLMPSGLLGPVRLVPAKSIVTPVQRGSSIR